MALELISILISTFNRSRCLDELLARLTTMFGGEPLEIIVFDDASSDDTAAVCAKYAQTVRSIRSTENIGYIAGRARLMREARGEFLAFLDDDSCFIDSGALQRIRETFAAHPNCGVIACNIASSSAAGGQVPRGIAALEVGEFIGCGHVLRAEAVQKVGSYPGFLSGYGAEEILVALRMLDAGYTIVLSPDIRVYHAEEPSRRPNIERRAATIVNELAIVLSCYPGWLIAAGIARKLLSHVLFNLRNGSSAALTRAGRRLPMAFLQAFAERTPVRTRTLRRWLRLRRNFARAATKWKNGVPRPNWHEIESMFVSRANFHG